MIELVKKRVMIYSLIVSVELAIIVLLGVLVYKIRSMDFDYQDQIIQLRADIDKGLEDRKILITDLSFVTSVGYLMSLVSKDKELSHEFVHISPDKLYSFSQFAHQYGRKLASSSSSSYSLNIK